MLGQAEGLVDEAGHHRARHGGGLLEDPPLPVEVGVHVGVVRVDRGLVPPAHDKSGGPEHGERPQGRRLLGGQRADFMEGADGR